MKFAESRKGLAIVIIAGLLLGMAAIAGFGYRTASAAAPDATELTVPSPVQLSSAFSKIAKEVESSVVQVESTIERRTARRRGGEDMLPFEDRAPDLFRRFFGDTPFGMPQEPRRSQSSGSGFIVDSRGYILTNHHVIDGATRVKVRITNDPTDYIATIVGTDPELDLAVLKIDAGKPLKPVKIGNSDAVEVGDWAIAIGSPFGLEATVTAGIISAKGRAIGDEDHQLQRFLQTDAAINPGNSGGPLLDIKGQAIGVNTMIATVTGAYQGVGFALPINLAVNSYNQIIKTGKVSRGAIGIKFSREQKPELLKVYGGGESGVFVTEVTKGTPADEAGMRQGDIITSYNGKPVKDGEDLVSMVSQTPVGTSVPVTVLRDGKPITMTLRIGDRQEIIAGDTQRRRPGTASSEGENKAVKFGISVRSLSPSERREANFNENGVLVTDVDADSFAEDLGIRQGDIITAVNRQEVSTPEDLKRIAGGLKPGDPVAFKVMRNTAALGLRGRGSSDWQAFFVAGTLPRS
ncbi:MAG: Do family serine endopeptidase [Rhodospirillales bacterium]